LDTGSSVSLLLDEQDIIIRGRAADLPAEASRARGGIPATAGGLASFGLGEAVFDRATEVYGYNTQIYASFKIELQLEWGVN